jgi:pyruvate formate lyase activating enzyme
MKLRNDKILIFDMQRGSFVDGPGIRTTVFFKGCNLQCKWCHNPESQSPKQQILFYKDKCTCCGKCKAVCSYSLEKCDFCGKCALFCPNDAREICGKEYTVEEVLSEILKDKDYYNATGGVTFSGGECMLQIDFLKAILEKCKENGVHTAVDTAGNVPWDCFEKILPYTDLFLYDVKCFSEDLHKEGTGVSNRLILENLQKLSEKNAEIIVRIPVIPEFNDKEAEMQKIADYLKGLRLNKVDLLPYHAMGEHKWSAIGKEAEHFTVPNSTDVDDFKKLFNSF